MVNTLSALPLSGKRNQLRVVKGQGTFQSIQNTRLWAFLFCVDVLMTLLLSGLFRRTGDILVFFDVQEQSCNDL